MPDIDINTDANNSVDINIETDVPQNIELTITPHINLLADLETSPLYGPKGEDGRDGVDGQDGFSPIATVTKTDNTATITITDVNGTTTATVSDGQDGVDGVDGVDGQDGFSPIASVSKIGNTATISITDSNGTTTATVSDGVDGTDGTDGIDGVDGYSPIATVSKLNDTATITITDKNGTTTATVSDGQDGINGQDGQDGYSPIATVVKSGSTATITITDKNGTTTAQVSDGITPTVPTALSSFTDDLGSNPVHTHSQYLTSHQDISGKANTDLDNLSATGKTTVVTVANELDYVNAITVSTDNDTTVKTYTAPSAGVFITEVRARGGSNTNKNISHYMIINSIAVQDTRFGVYQSSQAIDVTSFVVSKGDEITYYSYATGGSTSNTALATFIPFKHT